MFLIFISVVLGIASRAFYTVQKCSTKELHPYARIKALKKIVIFWWWWGKVSHDSPGFHYVVQVVHKFLHSCVGLLSTGIIYACMGYHLSSGLNIVFLFFHVI